MFSVFAIQITWYLYARNYNEKYNGGIFLIGILPVWDMNIIQIKNTLDAIQEHVKWDYVREETQIVFAIMFLSIIILYKKSNKILLLLTIASSILFLFFTSLFFQALKDHDYYTIDLFILTPVILLTFFLLLKNQFHNIYKSLLFRIIVIAFLIHNVDFARRRMDGRYNAEGWQNENYITKIKSFREISPYLRSIGITSDDKVLSLSDNSINISLYLMNQKGWTNYGMFADSLKIKEKIRSWEQNIYLYMIRIHIKKKVFNHLLKTKIGEFKNIDIYKL